MASAVSFGSSSARAMEANAASTASCPTPFTGHTASTSILPVVMVPVLSRHSVSTRASVSMQYSCCTSTFDFAKRTTATASTVDVSRMSPSGIMPTSAATVDRMAWSSATPSPLKNMRANSSAPTGKITQLTNLMMPFRLFMISELTALCCLASALIFAA